MHRKKFIQQLGMTGGGLLLRQQFATAYPATDQAILRIGVIGCGDRGHGMMSLLKEMTDKFTIVACCDILRFRIDAAQQTAPAARVYHDYHALLDDKHIDAVIIATPLHLHFPVAVAALQAGKHVYLEKTMTFSLTETIELVNLSKKYSSLVLQVGHQYRYTPLYFKVKEMITTGYLGKVTQVETRWDRNWNWRRSVPAGYTDQQINWRMYRKYSGGLVAELLSHQIDFINWAFDTHPDVIYGTGGIDYYKDGRETYDNVQVTMRYNKAGMIGNFGATCANEREGYIFKLKGTKGTVMLLMNEGFFYPEKQTRKQLEIVDGVTGATKIEWTKDGGIPILNTLMKEGSWYALEAFYKSIEGQTLPVSNTITGGTTAICVHLANEAIYNNTIQYWNDTFNFSA